MAFWADCVKFVRSEVLKTEILAGNTPIKFESAYLTIPAGQPAAYYKLTERPGYCIVSLSGGSDQSLEDQDTHIENAVVGYSPVQNSVYVMHREIVDHPMYYMVDIMCFYS